MFCVITLAALEMSPIFINNFRIYRHRPKGVLPQRCSADFWRIFDAILTDFWRILDVPLVPIKQDPFWRHFWCISDAFLTHFWRILAIADAFSENTFWTMPNLWHIPLAAALQLSTNSRGTTNFSNTARASRTSEQDHQVSLGFEGLSNPHPFCSPKNLFGRTLKST